MTKLVCRFGNSVKTSGLSGLNSKNHRRSELFSQRQKNMAGKLEVDTNGFKKRVSWRGPLGGLAELISNAPEENITFCAVVFVHVDRQKYRMRVEDDSVEGFRNLDESFTLYADSYKAGILDKRGRFNVGEKIAIVLCDDARIESTTGTRIFLDGQVK